MASTSATSEVAASSSQGENASGNDAVNKRTERLKRLEKLYHKRNEARNLNHLQVVEEDKRSKLPTNYEAKKARVEWQLQEETARKEAAQNGEDFEQQKRLQQSADDLEKIERKRKKKNADPGFSDYNAAQLRQYQRLIKEFKPDMGQYNRLKEELDEELYPDADSLSYGGQGKTSEAAIDRMVADLDKQMQKRAKFSRRRQHFDENDVDYINERNAVFNKKIARFYNKYTAEIKQNLERGTAI
ncbi:Pre-mRNA-splicing factor syf2 [Trichoplax sp. H2]|nr:Pre-mRNA-splicing factor syf2 [Trichoplax sp. H2]|eukprot:RDD43612.1 Pre-mRNA-splicing factor syf2 [Trichoplax sp. H2]